MRKSIFLHNRNKSESSKNNHTKRAGFWQTALHVLFISGFISFCAGSDEILYVKYTPEYLLPMVKTTLMLENFHSADIADYEQLASKDIDRVIANGGKRPKDFDGHLVDLITKTAVKDTRTMAELERMVKVIMLEKGLQAYPRSNSPDEAARIATQMKTAIFVDVDSLLQARLLARCAAAK